MSSFNRRTLLTLPLALPAVLAACGFTPAYGPAGPAQGLQGRIRAADPGDKDGFDFVTGIEARFGRQRITRWGARTLDIDLLAMGDAVLPDLAEQSRWRTLPPEDQARIAPDRLILPHPRLQDRAFVLVPLADVAADWRHPVLGLSVAEMLAALPASARAEIVHLNPAASF